MPESAEEYLARQDKEWSQYVAVAPVLYGGVLAANPGQAIPASHPLIAAWVESGVVAKTSTKAAQAVTETKGA